MGSIKIFRRIIFFTGFVLLCFRMHATECSDVYYLEEHINFRHCQYHYRESVSLEYRARIRAVNDYIAYKKERGEWCDKKIEMKMEDWLSIPYFSVTKASKAIYIYVGGTRIDLEFLMRIIDILANPDFKYFEFNVEDMTGDDYHEELNKRLNRYDGKREENLGAIFKKEYVMWQENALRINYNWETDKLEYALFGETLPFKVVAFLPSVIRDRYIIPVAEEPQYYASHLYVYQDSVLIKKFKLHGNSDYYEEEFLHGIVYDKWVDFCRYNSCKYSYSYDKNRFYFFDPPIELDISY